MVAMETTRFLSYELGQRLLLPPDLREWLEEGHLAYFILDVVETLDLSEIFASYDGSRGGVSRIRSPPAGGAVAVWLLRGGDELS
jgi:hypothetical protein